MPDITNPQAVAFGNRIARRTADAIDEMYETCKRFQQEWAAYGVAGIMPDTADFLIDGAEIDGRRRAQGRNFYALKTMVDNMVSWLEAAPGAGDSVPRINRVKQLSVNGRPRL